MPAFLLSKNWDAGFFIGRGYVARRDIYLQSTIEKEGLFAVLKQYDIHYIRCFVFSHIDILS